MDSKTDRGRRRFSRLHIHQARVNGGRLVFSMNPAPREAPIILYLHCGPGDACIPLTMRYNAELEEDFRFINLDQRGSGLSYYPFASDESVTISSMVEDIHRFVLTILRAYRQDSLILIGHSWDGIRTAFLVFCTFALILMED